MILSIDPIARELVVDREDGRPRFEIPLDSLVIKYFAEGGILFAEFGRDGIGLGFKPDDDGGAAEGLREVVPGRWRVSVSPSNPKNRR